MSGQNWEAPRCHREDLVTPKRAFLLLLNRALWSNKTLENWKQSTQRTVSIFIHLALSLLLVVGSCFLRHGCRRVSEVCLMLTSQLLCPQSLVSVGEFILRLSFLMVCAIGHVAILSVELRYHC